MWAIGSHWRVEVRITPTQQATPVRWLHALPGTQYYLALLGTTAFTPMGLLVHTCVQGSDAQGGPMLLNTLHDISTDLVFRVLPSWPILGHFRVIFGYEKKCLFGQKNPWDTCVVCLELCGIFCRFDPPQGRGVPRMPRSHYTRA